VGRIQKRDHIFTWTKPGIDDAQKSDGEAAAVQGSHERADVDTQWLDSVFGGY
jgi:hypothetical protein